MSDQRFSTKIGEEYDLFGLSVPHHNDIQRATVLKLLPLLETTTADIRVLEIGFGTGLTSEAILQANARVVLVGVDSEPEMLTKADERLKEYAGRYTLKIEDALSFLKASANNDFDAVISVWTLHNLDNQLRSDIFSEIYRALKVGGIFVNGDKIAVSDKTEHEKHLAWQLKQFDIYDTIDRSDLKKEWVEHYHEDEKTYRILVDDVMQDTLQKIGFKDCHVKERWYMDAVAVAYK